MASKQKTRSGSALDPMMAGFAGGAAAFVIYAMPPATFDGFVALSGLPLVLAAAQPPLGMTARFAVMAAAGIGSAMLVYLVLRALGKPAPRPKRRGGPVAIEIPPPVLRRADAHPDAPSRRPILAGVDLGRPFDDLPVGEHESWDDLPGADEANDLPAYETATEDVEPAYESPTFEEEAPQPEQWLPNRDFASDEPAYAEDEHDYSEQRPVPGFLAAQAEQPDEEPLDLSTDEIESVSTLSQRLPEPEEEFSDGIPELMKRLEAGLVRRPPSHWSEPHQGNGAAPLSTDAPPPLDARLRGAISELQKLAGRGH